MQSFQFTEPYIYPNLEKVDKDTKGNPITTNGKIIKKWCIRYKISFVDGTAEHRKEYGRSYIKSVKGQALNKITDLKKKIIEANIILEWVKDDLARGIDPENREEEVRKATLKAVEDAQRFRYRYVFDLWFASKNYINPIPSKVISAKNLEAFHLNQFLPYLESKGLDCDIRLITDDVINAYIKENYNSGKWSAFTASTRVGWVSGLFTYAFQNKIILINPMTYVQKITEDKIIIKDGIKTLKMKKENRFNIYTAVELERVFAAVHDTKDEAIYKTLFFAFIRFSEIFRLTISNLDLHNSRFIIQANLAKGQRNGETAYVKIYAELKECLGRYLQNQFKGKLNPTLPLFPLDANINKEDIYNNFYTRYKTVLRRLKNDAISPIEISKTPYALKHTGAQLYINQNKQLNVPPYKILEGLQHQMRHVDITTTQKYMKKDLGIDFDEETTLSFGKLL